MNAIGYIMLRYRKKYTGECKLLTRQCGFKLLLNIPNNVTKESTCMQYIYTLVLNSLNLN